MSKVAFHTLGCKVNQYETEAITEQFIAAGYEVVEFEDPADVYVVNTCTVTNIADKKSRKMLSKAKKMNDDSVVVAVGCYVQVAHDSLEDTPYIDVLIGNTHKNEVVSIVEDYISNNKHDDLIEDVHHDIVYEELHIDTQQSKARSTIKIQDGCNQYCTYCIIPYTRGAIRSRQPESVLGEVRGLALKGYHEIILTGIHLGSYGKDLDNVELIDLIEALDEIDGIDRIRLGSLEPNFITPELLGRLVKCQSVCDHFHLSMQSGSDSVLARMKRHYRSGDYKAKVDLIREYYKTPGITTDVIVGFPMETEEEARETYEFVNTIKFSDLHVFKYSIRKGTKAAEMKPQVDGLIKTKRSKELSHLGESMRDDFLGSFIGESVDVLLEDELTIDGCRYYSGHTTNYMKVYVKVTSVEDKKVGFNSNINEEERSQETSDEMIKLKNDYYISGSIKSVKIKELFKDGILGEMN